MAARIKYESGQRIENTRLVYLEEAARTNPKRRCAKFRCDCGNEITTDLNWVRFLNVTSCGCWKTEVVTEKNTKHSHAPRGAQSGAYRSWQAMHQRAGRKGGYEHVSVCPRWDDFANFLQDMGERPDGMTIERKDGLGNYEPSNCVWATPLEQAQNTTQTVKVTISGETHSINEWCRIKEIGYHVVKQRRARGMGLTDAITTPINKSKQGRKK